MRKTAIFNINGKKRELPLLEKGDRVKPKEGTSFAIDATGTVESVKANGLLVDVVWDKEKYESKTGGLIELGKGRMIDGLILVEE